MADDSLTTDGGKSIDAQGLAKAVFVAITGAFAGGFADTIGAYLNSFFVEPIQGIGSFLGELVSAPFVILTNAVYGSVAGAEGFIAQFGLLAPALGVGIAITTYYAFRWVMQYGG